MRNATQLHWESIKERLVDQGLALTGYRRAVLEGLRTSGPLTAAEVRDALSPHAPHRVTVYRTLESLERAGLVKTVRFRHEDEDRFELGEAVRPHHHHAICESCGTTQAIEGCRGSNLPLKLPRRFKAIAHQLEVYGLCARCQRRAA
ncbi:MAG: transcriptional repressor [bacterium]|nr:transcriptional repressor [bacterium]